MIKIEYVDIDKLKFSEYNPRKWSDREKENLKESIKRFGLVDPVIVNKAVGRENIIIGGHFRVKIAKELGIKKVPVVYVNIEDIKKEKELNLRLNKNLGEWDEKLLSEFDLDLLEDVGWEKDELEKIFSLETKEDNFNAREEYEKIQEPFTKYGDIYLLGKHRLMCGDATKLEDVEKLMGGKKARLVFTDPPYNIGLDYSKNITKSKSFKTKKKINDSKSREEYKNFLEQVLDNILKVVEQDSHIFFWCDEKYIYLIQELYFQRGIKLQRVNLWIKNHFYPVPQNAFNKVYEPCVYGTLGKPPLNKNYKNLTEILNKDLKNGVDVKEKLLELLNVWLDSREREYIHTTQKPVSLTEKALKRCSFPNDIVLDVFGGSGSTLIGCEQLKRRCFMMEIDPVYCDVIIKRWERFTGLKAVKVER